MDIHHNLMTPREGEMKDYTVPEMLKMADDIHAAAMAAIAERDALAAQNVELRGALEESLPYVNGFPNSNAHTLAQIAAALSLPLPAAAAKVAAMREKAELLEKCEAALAEICEIAARECPHEDHESMADFYSGSCDRMSGRAYALLSALRAARGAE